MTTKLYSILTNGNLTQSQVAQAALEIIRDNALWLSELRKLSEVCRDSEATCKYPEVLKAVKEYLDSSISNLLAELQLECISRPIRVTD